MIVHVVARMIVKKKLKLKYVHFCATTQIISNIYTIS